MPQTNPSVGRHAYLRSVIDRLLNTYTYICGIAVLFSLLSAVVLPGVFGVSKVAAAQNSTLTFQARILTAPGRLIPDGYYNAEFKLYDVSSGGTALWTETYLNSVAGNDLQVKNGYLYANLGTITSFPSTINWDQELYLTLNIGNTNNSCTPFSSCSPDGEMSPRFKVTATPYAFKANSANNVQTNNTNAASTNSNGITIQTGNATGSTSNSGNITIDTGTATGTTGTITLGATNASGLTLGRSGLTTQNAGGLTVSQLLTANGGMTIATGSTFTNASSSLFTALAISDLPTGGAIGTAAATVDVATTFNVNQTTSGQTLSLPTPTTTTAGRLVFINNVGSASFTMYGNPIAAGKSSTFIWNGSGWVQTISFTSTGVDTIGALDGGTANANGAYISGTTIYLQSASASYAGLVSTGTQTFAGNKTFNGSVVLAASQSLTLTGGNTASRPGSPTEGMVYFDTDTDRLLVYSNGKWQTDNREAILVAASNSSQADKDAADYVADGNTGAANDGDQVQINSALTAASGRKVVLLAGTYVADATILVPNDTTLAGVGKGTVIQLADIDATDNLIEATGSSRTGQVIRDLGLDGQKSAQTGAITQYGIYLDSVGSGSGSGARQGAILENLWVSNFETSGIVVQDSQNTKVDKVSSSDNDSVGIHFNASANNRHNQIINSRAQGNGQTGIWVESWEDYVVSNNIASGNTQRGFIISAAYSTVTGNTAYGNSQDGMQLSYGGNSSITGNHIYNNGVTGITIYNAAYLTVNGNTLQDNGGTDSNEGIKISDDSDYNQIIGNTITDTSCNITCYAINIAAASENLNYFEGNRYSDTDADSGDDATINDAGTGTIYAGQSTGTTSGTDVSNFLFRGANSTTAFAVQNASGTSVFNVDTSTPGVTVTGTATVTSNLTVDTNTLFVSAANDYVSVGSTSDLGGKLQVVGAADETQLLIRANGTQSLSNPLVLLQNSSGSELARINASTSSLYFGNAAGGSNASGANNTAIGASALGVVSTGTANTTLGSGALASITTGSNSTAVGYNAGNLATGGNNIFIGYQAGDNVTTGTDNIIIGYNLDASAAGVSNELRIGGILQGSTSTLAATFNGSLAITTLGTADTNTYLCRNSSNIISGCVVSPLSSTLTDNVADALDIQEGTNNYININTTNGSENISFGNSTTNPSYSFLGTGTTTFNGNLVVAATKSLTITGGNTASRPGSPTEGMVYYDTTTKQLLTYANGKWQADRSTSTKIVAASNSSQALKDAADYVADGTSDQTEINNALIAAAGGKVYLTEGTFTIDASISIPSNTTLTGSGSGTLITIPNALNTGFYMIMNSNAGTTTGNSGITISNLRIDGKGTANTGNQIGINFDANFSGTTDLRDLRVENVTMLDVDLGIYSEAVESTIINNNISLVATGGVSRGFDIEIGGKNVITGNNVSGGGTGIYIDSSNFNVVTSNTFLSLVRGLEIGAASNNQVSNNTFDTISSRAIYLGSLASNNVISSNSIQDSGDAANNNGIYLSSADYNSITDNLITDTSCTSDCYAINISNSNSDKNYLDGNRFTGSAANTASINDSGTNTIYAGQQTNSTTSASSNVSDFRFRGSTNSTTTFSVQNASGTNILNVDTTNSEVEIGNSATAGRLVISDGSSNTGTILVNATAGDYTFTIPTVTANDTFCLQTLNNCPGNSKFTDGGSFTYLTQNTDELVVGGTASVSAKLAVIGTADQTQLLIRANATQSNSNPLIRVEDSAGSELFSIRSKDNASFFLGVNAGDSVTSGTGNIGIGVSSLTSITTQGENTALGAFTLQSATSGGNTAVGTYALSGATSGSGANTAIGKGALQSTSTGGFNTSLGYNTGYYNQTGSGNTIIGAAAAQGVSGNSFSNNSILGASGGQAITTGSDNTLLGYNVASNLTSGSSNIIIGSGVNAVSATGSNQLNIGDSIYGDLSNDRIAVGTSTTSAARLTVNNSTSTDAIFVAQDNGTAVLTVADGGNVTATGQVAVGGATNQTQLIVKANASQTENLTTSLIMAQTSAGSELFRISSRDIYSVFMGFRAGMNDDGGGNQNTGVGSYALWSNTTGYYNTAFGSNALNSNVGGAGNTAVGQQALTTNVGGVQNTAVGGTALGSSTGNYNTAFGFEAGSNLTSAGNVLMGYKAGDNITTGSYNILYGYEIDAPSATADYQLNIGNILFGTNVNGTGTTLSTGGLGIGVTSPGARLEVKSQAAGSQIAMIVDNNTSTGNIFEARDNGTAVLTVADGGALTVSSLTTLNGGLTVETGDTFTFNGDAFTDLTGTGLAISSGALTVDATSASGFFKNGGNAFTAASALGNTGNYDLNIITNNNTRLTVEADGDLVLAAGLSLRVTGGNTASRPSSPTEGMVYFDTSTKQLLVYANGKWQQDRTDAVLVAASNSSQSDKDAADYVADGNTGAANDGDQVQINSALTAGSGKKVVMLAGTYTVDASISVPNNTTLSGVGNGTLITIPNSFGDDLSAIVNADTTTGTNITIRDLKLDGNKANQSASVSMTGIYLNNMGNTTTRIGATITGVQSINWYFDVAINPCSEGYGICLESSSSNTIADNIFNDNGQNGIALLSSSQYNTITGNTVNGNSSGIIIFSTATDNTITGNTVNGNSSYGIYNDGSNNTITGNTINSNGNSGYVSNTGSGNTITGNTVNNNVGNGIYIVSSSGNTITANKANSNTSGISLSNSSNNTVTGNTVSSNGDGIYTSGTSSANVINGNSLSSNTSRGIRIESDTNTISSNVIKDSGNTTTNEGIYVTGDFNAITDNYITDSNCSSTCRAINLLAGADKNYLSGNRYSGTASVTALINNVGTSTIYAGQYTLGSTSTDSDVGSFSFRGSTDSSNAFSVVQASSGTSILTVNTNSSSESVSVSGYLTASKFASVGSALSGTTVALTVNNNTSTGNIANFQDGGTNVLVVADGGNVGIKTGTNSISSAYDLTFGDTADRTIGVLTRTTNAAGNSLTVSAGSAGSGGSAFSGGALTLQGGSAAGTGSANGGNVVITGGAGTGSGVRGLVVIDTATYSAATVQNFTGNANITQANTDTYGSILISGDVAGRIATLTDPTNTTAGRVVYVTNSGTVDITLAANSGGTALSITLKPTSTATMYWNGVDWTAAGASSSTDLQAAYNNTAASAGNAEIVLSSTGTGGLTIRNDATTAITGGLLEVQTSIGSNLFTVNNNATEYASNGGAESSTFTAWTAHGTGPSVTRYTTAGNNIATGVGSVFVDTTSTANTGAKNTLSSSLTANLRYKVSYTARHTSSTGTFTTLETYFSNDGTTASVECGSDATIYYNTWTRIDCTFTPTSVGASNAILFRHTDAVEHDFYIDNFSVTIDASSNHAVDGAVDSALGTNWQGYDADGGAGTSSVTRDTTNIYDTSGAVADVTTAHINQGIRNNMAITPSVSTQYLVTFYAKLASGTFTDLTVGFLPAGGNSAPVTAQLCADYNTRTLSTSTWTKITCIFTTPSSGITDPDLVIYQPTATARTFYVDALSITLNTNNSSNVQVGGGNKGGPTTLFTLDRSNGAPIAANNDAYLGSMYYDTSTGRIQCYEADGWGACGAAPDNIVNLNPEYAGAVLNGTGVGTMTADFCSNDTALSVNSSLCSSGQAKNYYRWTSPQATQQTYSIYVTYQLPATFNGFSDDNTVLLTGRVDNTSNASVTYEMYKSTGSAVTQCGTGETNVITGGGGSANTWYSYGINGNEATGCSFNSSSAGNFVIFKINLKANSNANAYVSTLSFTTTGR